MTLRVGIVGCGAVARHHVPALRAARGVQLTAAFDLDEAPAAGTGAPVAGSLDELIEAVDLVAVCTPPEHHADVAVAALEAGRKLFVEKPLATTLADADRILAAGEGATGFQLRCHRKVPSRADSIHGIWGGPATAAVGPLLDRAVHHVDLWRALLGDEVRTARMTGSRLEAEMRGGAEPYVELVEGGPARNELSSMADRSTSTGWTGSSTACATRESSAAAAPTSRRSSRSGRRSPRAVRPPPSPTGGARLR